MYAQRASDLTSDPDAGQVSRLAPNRFEGGTIDKIERLAVAQRATLAEMSQAIKRQRRHIEALQARVAGATTRPSSQAARRRQGRARAPLLATAIFAAALLGAQGTADAYMPGSPFGDAQPLSEATLSGMRGGFVLPNGMNLRIGARIETLRNGVLQLRTSINFDSPTRVTVETLRNGVTTETVVNGPNGVTTSVGDSGSTLITHSVGPNRLFAAIQNTVADTSFTHNVTLDVTITNFSQLTNNFQAGKLHGVANLMNFSLVGALP